MISTLTAASLREDMDGRGKLIDVRSAAEFAIGHIPGALNVPMEQVEARTADLGDGPLVLICEAGTRAAIVAGWLEQRQDVAVLSGGTAAWRKASLPLVACAPCRWTLERQVRLVAGMMVLVAAVLSVVVSLRWVYLAMFIGAGLTFAGATNICGMAAALGRMPWNRGARPKSATLSDSSARCCS